MKKKIAGNAMKKSKPQPKPKPKMPINLLPLLKKGMSGKQISALLKEVMQ